MVAGGADRELREHTAVGWRRTGPKKKKQSRMNIHARDLLPVLMAKNPSLCNKHAAADPSEIQGLQYFSAHQSRTDQATENVGGSWVFARSPRYSSRVFANGAQRTFFSTMRMRGFSISHIWVLLSVTKYGEMYPRSNFIPSTTSISFSSVLPSWVSASQYFSRIKTQPTATKNRTAPHRTARDRTGKDKTRPDNKTREEVGLGCAEKGGQRNVDNSGHQGETQTMVRSLGLQARMPNHLRPKLTACAFTTTQKPYVIINSRERQLPRQPSVVPGSANDGQVSNYKVGSTKEA